MAFRVSARLTAAEGRRFGLTIGACFLALAVLWRDRPIPRALLTGIGLSLVGAGLLVPRSLGPVFRAWMGLAKALSRVTTPIVLGIVYFVVLTPIGLVRRALSHRILEQQDVGGSFWLSRGDRRRSDLRRQF